MKVLDSLEAEWRVLARTAESIAAVDALAGRCMLPDARTLDDLVRFMRIRGAPAAVLFAALLREADAHPLVRRCLLQATVPGLIGVGQRLRWGEGGEWESADDFCVDALATTWEILGDWAGADRPYAVLDLLSGVRLRLRRRLIHERQVRERFTDWGVEHERADRTDSALEEAARLLIDHHRNGTPNVAPLYTTAILGYPGSTVAARLGVSRSTLSYRLKQTRREILT